MKRSRPALGVENIEEATCGIRLAFLVGGEQQLSSQGNCLVERGPELLSEFPDVQKSSSSWGKIQNT